MLGGAEGLCKGGANLLRLGLDTERVAVATPGSSVLSTRDGSGADAGGGEPGLALTCLFLAAAAPRVLLAGGGGSEGGAALRRSLPCDAHGNKKGTWGRGAEMVWTDRSAAAQHCAAWPIPWSSPEDAWTRVRMSRLISF